MPREDIKEEKEFEESQVQVQLVTQDQLINFKLDRILELLESVSNQQK